MLYQIEYKSKAVEDLDRLSHILRQRIYNKLKWFAENFEQIVPESLTGDFSDLFKLRIGDYRVIYDVDVQSQTIVVIRIDHRSKIYKRNL